MCSKSCIEFGQAYLKEEDIHNRKVIEVGSYDVNGSLRSIVESFNPQSYVGVDIVKGPGVDEICDINDLITRYGIESFDLVISTELIEHVRNWRNAVSNLKNILKPNGILLLTTRSKWFPYHSAPFDFWRYEVEDMEVIFSDLSIEIIERDPSMPGVFVKAHKPVTFSERNLEDYDLYSIVLGRRCGITSEFDIFPFKVKVEMKLRSLLTRVLPPRVKSIIKKVFFKGEWV